MVLAIVWVVSNRRPSVVQGKDGKPVGKTPLFVEDMELVAQLAAEVCTQPLHDRMPPPLSGPSPVLPGALPSVHRVGWVCVASVVVFVPVCACGESRCLLVACVCFGPQGTPQPELPPLHPIFGGLSPSLAADLVAVWMFLQLFAEPLRLVSIGLDDFAQAVTYPGGDNVVVVQVCVLAGRVGSALCCAEWGRRSRDDDMGACSSVAPPPPPCLRGDDFGLRVS